MKKKKEIEKKGESFNFSPLLFSLFFYFFSFRVVYWWSKQGFEGGGVDESYTQRH